MHLLVWIAGALIFVGAVGLLVGVDSPLIWVAVIAVGIAFVLTDLNMDPTQHVRSKRRS